MAVLNGGAALSGTRFQVDVEVDGSCWWRLTASNGRVVAMAATPYADRDECRAAFMRLCADIERLPGELHHAQGGTGWKWRLHDRAGAIAAVSPRTYERHPTCRTAYERFRALLAEVGAGRVTVWDDAGRP